MDGKGRGPGARDPRQRRQDLSRCLGEKHRDLGFDGEDVCFQSAPALDVTTQPLGAQLGVGWPDP